MTIVNVTVCDLGARLELFKNYEDTLSIQLWLSIPVLLSIGLVYGHPRHGAYVFIETPWHRANFGTHGYKIQRSDGGKPPSYTTLKASGVMD